MSCMAPTNELFHTEKYFPTERISWVRKHHIENEHYSDEEKHVEYHPSQEKQTLDRLKEIQDLSMRATLLNAEHRYAEQEPVTPNRKRRLTEYNSSPDRSEPFPHDNGHLNKLTLSQFAVSASEQEPLYPDDEDVEEILMRLRHGHDYYRPQASAPPSFPLLFPPPPPNQMRSPYYEPTSRYPPQPHMPLPPHHAHSNPHNKGSLFHILSQEGPESVHAIHPHQHPHYPHHPHHAHPHPHHINNTVHMRKLFFEDGLVESSDEQDLEFPKAKKIRRENKVKSPLKSIVVSSNDDVQEKENIAQGLCFKTHKPKVQREYYYAKLSKTIFRWTCCGSQAKTHPDA